MHNATSSLFESQMGKDAKKLGDQLRYSRSVQGSRVCRASSAGVGRERNHARSHGLLAARCPNVQCNIAFLLADFSAKERFLEVDQGINQKAIPNEHLAFSTYKNSIYRMSK